MQRSDYVAQHLLYFGNFNMLLVESVAFKTYIVNMGRPQETLQADLRDYSQISLLIKRQFPRTRKHCLL